MSPVQEEPPMSPDTYDVLIVGAGPVGLLAALSAASRCAGRIAVVDQTSKFGPAGQNVDMQPNGMDVLRAISPEAYATVSAHVSRTARLSVVDVDGALLETIVRRGDRPVSVLWHKLQATLLDALPARVRVFTNHRLQGLEQDEGRVCVRLARNWVRGAGRGGGMTNFAYESAAVDSPEGGEESVEMFARFVVGADGINSQARRSVYRDAGGWGEYARPEYSGTCVFIGQALPKGCDDVCAAVREKYFGEHGFVTFVEPRGGEPVVNYTRPMVINVPGGAPGWSWSMNFNLYVSEERAKNATDDELTDEVLRVLREQDFPPEFLQLAEQMYRGKDASPQVSRRPRYVVPACHPPPYTPPSTASVQPDDYPADFARPWGHGRVALVGDAAHGMPPFLAQGVGMGFEDVAELMPRLDKAGLFEPCEGQSEADVRGALKRVGAAVDDYHDARLERICRAQKEGLSTGPETTGLKMELFNYFWDYEVPAQ